MMRVLINSYRYVLIFILMNMFCIALLAQERIFAIGYTRNFVNDDSSNVSLTLDMNRMPGKTEGAGTFFVINEPVFKKVNLFAKPVADVNLGSYTTLAANNVAVGLPFGLLRKLSKDDVNSEQGVFYGSLEAGPDLIADKSFRTYLYYFSAGFSLNFSYTDKKETVIDIATGLKYATGERLQDVKTKLKNKYNKFIFPLGISMSAFKSKSDTYHHLKFSGLYKYNHIIKDDPLLSPSKDRSYVQLKLDLYFMEQLGFNITYTSGYEEPLFKKVHSIAFGLVLARKG